MKLVGLLSATLFARAFSEPLCGFILDPVASGCEDPGDQAVLLSKVRAVLFGGGGDDDPQTGGSDDGGSGGDDRALDTTCDICRERYGSIFCLLVGYCRRRRRLGAWKDRRMTRKLRRALKTVEVSPTCDPRKFVCCQCSDVDEKTEKQVEHLGNYQCANFEAMMGPN